MSGFLVAAYLPRLKLAKTWSFGSTRRYIYKPPLIKWACKHKLWEKLETAAFSPRLLQIGWPPGPIWKESLLKWLPKGHSPQTSRGGKWQWACGLTVGHFFKLFCLAFLNDIFEPSDIILEPLGFYFGSLWDAFLWLLAIEVLFWKLSSRADESSKKNVPG